MRQVDETKRIKRGALDPKPEIADEKKRTFQVASWMNAEEIQEVDRQRAVLKMRRGEVLRAVFFGTERPVLPEINKTALKELSLIGSNINQLAKFVNSNGEIKDLALEVTALLRQVQKACRGFESGDKK